MTDERWRTLTIKACVPAQCPHCRMAMGEGVGKTLYLICELEGMVIKGKGFPGFCPLPILGGMTTPTKEQDDAP